MIKNIDWVKINILMNDIDVYLPDGLTVHAIGWGCPIYTYFYNNNDIQGIMPILKQINFFVPFAEMGSLLTMWGAYVGMYYGMSVFLRWAKAIG